MSGDVSGKQVRYSLSPMSGADPELFLSRDGVVIGAEKVIPKEGIKSVEWTSNLVPTIDAVVLDGVQVELHPPARGCRQAFSQNISYAMTALKNHLLALQAKGEKVEACFDQTVRLSRTELDSLSEAAKQLGCAPSENAYGEPSIDCKGKVIRTRSAGGHIHLGFDYGNGTPILNHFNGTDYTEAQKEERLKLVKQYPGSYFPFRDRVIPKIESHKELGTRLATLLDIFLGNTCVLIDRDEGAAERRKLYGKAGEHRLPKHGVEYRVLSNFWLRHYVLTSMVLGQARLAVNVLSTGTLNGAYQDAPWDAEGEILKSVDLDQIRQAINTNDVDLAWKNWEPVKKFLVDHAREFGAGISGSSVKNFDRFATKIQKKGLGAIFPRDPLTHWTDKWTYNLGWERFIGAGDFKPLL